jgi:hypothetical protein
VFAEQSALPSPRKREEGASTTATALGSVAAIALNQF